jgi:hypothetical protein
MFARWKREREREREEAKHCGRGVKPPSMSSKCERARSAAITGKEGEERSQRGRSERVGVKLRLGQSEAEQMRTIDLIGRLKVQTGN